MPKFSNLLFPYKSPGFNISILSSNLCPNSSISPNFLPGTTTKAINNYGRYPCGYSPNTIIPASAGLIFPVLFSIIPFSFKIFLSENFERLGVLYKKSCNNG